MPAPFSVDDDVVLTDDKHTPPRPGVVKGAAVPAVLVHWKGESQPVLVPESKLKDAPPKP